MKRIHILALIFACCVLLTSCGFGAAEPTPTATRVPPTPTVTPSPTAAPPTPTPEPGLPILINWQDIGLPPDYVSLDPAWFGLGPGDYVWETLPELSIRSAFVFSNTDLPSVYGYLYDLPDPSLIEILDSCIEEGASCMGGVQIQDIATIGDISTAVDIQVDANLYISTIYFRYGDIGASVFVVHATDETLVVDLAHLATVYLESIRSPVLPCRISATPVEGMDWPTYNLTATGFYPQEGRAIVLSGDVTIGGEVQSTGTTMMGGTGESFNPAGELEEIVMFPLTMSDDTEVIPPSEVKINVIGHFSLCVAEGVFPWP